MNLGADVRRALALAAVPVLLTGCDTAAQARLALSPAPAADRPAEYRIVEALVASTAADFELVQRPTTPSSDRSPAYRMWGDGTVAVVLDRDSEGQLSVTVSEFPASYLGRKSLSLWGKLQEVLREEFGTRVIVAAEPRM